MVFLLTHPALFADEAAHLNRMLEAHPALIVHLRKPEMDRIVYEAALGGIAAAFHPRVVLHHHHRLCDFYDVKGVHFTERHRAKQPRHPRVVSTSFHTFSDAQNTGMVYDYFFCSPVFSSISKQGHSPTENWNITENSEAFRAKAVALGGVERSNLAAVQAKGFQHIAVLGAIWQSADPQAAMAELCEAMK